jgi:hypothetical protein
MEYVVVNIIEHSQLKGIKSNVRERKLRSDVYWQGVLKQRDLVKVGCKVKATCIC